MAKQYPVRIIPEPVFNENDVVFLAAGGPSLRSFDWDQLATKKVIAINKSLYKCPTAKILFWADQHFYQGHEEAILSHPASYKCTAYSDVVLFHYKEPIYTYKFERMRGFDDTVMGLAHGNNSGYAAMNLAVKLGARKLVLLGYDFCFDETGHSHWHEGHTLPNGIKQHHKEETLTKKMLPCFETLEYPLLEKRVTVYNANRGSNLKIWKQITHEEALALA